MDGEREDEGAGGGAREDEVSAEAVAAGVGGVMAEAVEARVDGDCSQASINSTHMIRSGRMQQPHSTLNSTLASLPCSP